MLQFLKYVLATIVGVCLASMLMFVITIIMIIALAASVSKSDKQVKILEPNSVLVADFDYDMPDHVEFNPFNNISLFKGINTNVPLGLDEWLRIIKHAENDDHIKGIYITSGDFPSGLATAKEIRDALLHFKETKKFIYVYSPAYSQKGYYIASAADKVFLNPRGGIEWKGLSINIMFFKNLMDKVGIAPEIFYCGKFKTATEPFRLNKMSDANREMSQGMIDDIKDGMYKEIAASRNLTTNALDSAANDLSVRTATDAKRLGFCDEIAYEDAVKSALKEALNLKGKKDISYISGSRYLSDIGDIFNKPDRIAILYAEGEITDGNGDEGITSERFMKALQAIRKDDHVKAVVIRVNSPGGSALASDEILHEINLLHKEKPVVISMGNYAASGGYYISCMADSILSQPYTLTGSIGVFGMAFNTEVLFSKNLGITFDHVNTHKHSDFFNANRPMSDAEKIYFQNGVDSTYMAFKLNVSNGRHMSVDSVEQIAQGHVWTGTQGLHNGLVDKIGNMDDAIRIAAALAHITNYSTTAYPKAKNDYHQLIKLFKSANDDDDDAHIKNLLGVMYPMYIELKQVQQTQGVQMRLPENIEIK